MESYIVWPNIYTVRSYLCMIISGNEFKVAVIGPSKVNATVSEVILKAIVTGEKTGRCDVSVM